MHELRVAGGVSVAERFGAVARLYAEGTAPQRLKAEILSLILALIDLHLGDRDHWVKIHLNSSLWALSMNLRREDRSSMLWLKFCVASLSEAFIPQSERYEMLRICHADLTELSYEAMLDDAQHLAALINGW